MKKRRVWIKEHLVKNKRKYKIVLFILLGVFLCLIIFGLLINPVLIGTIEIRTKSVSTKAINAAVGDVVKNGVVYDDLINIVTDELGNITMIQANPIEINKLSKDLAQTTEKLIDDFGELGIEIPIGSFSGIPILAGVGPNVNLKVAPIGAVSCKFISKFEQAGINQTIHRIYININANVGIVMPLYTKKFTSNQEVLISESIIVGSVPEVYLYSDSLSTLLNFVPY